MTQPKSILCLVCHKEVEMDFSNMENKIYIDHLASDHHIDYYRHLTLMLNLMEKVYVDNFANTTPAIKPKSLVCILCKKENSFRNEEGDEYSSHLKNRHMIVTNVKLIKAINLMDNEGLKRIIKKFEETYNVGDEVNENEEEKMLIEGGSKLENSLETSVSEQEEMFGELEEELRNGSEAIDYYKSKNGDLAIQNQSNAFINDSNYPIISSANDSVNSINAMEDSDEDPDEPSFDSTASLNSSVSSGSDSLIKQEPYSVSSRSQSIKTSTKGIKVETSGFSEAVQREIEKGELSTTMDIPFEKTHKKMKEITAMFMNGTSCTVCERNFNNKSHLHEHIESLHNPLPVFFCILCQLPMTSSARMRQHRKKCSQ